MQPITVLLLLLSSQSFCWILHDIDGKDCIYSFTHTDEPASAVWHIIPYCRERTDTSCQGISISFRTLKEKAVSTDELLYAWNAPIEVVNEYGKNPLNDNQFFCNCSRPTQFGRVCEYELEKEVNLNTVIRRQFAMTVNKNNFDDSVMCYMDLPGCVAIICLDWRQVCNGIVDCDGGEDEDGCLELEASVCDGETEFRCKNGMCIPKSFTFDMTFDCLDHSDEQFHLLPFSSAECHMNPSLDCEEHICHRLEFPCGDGQCVDNPSQSCKNGRNLFYLRLMFTLPTTANKNDFECWKRMLCVTEMNAIYEDYSGNKYCKTLCGGPSCIQRYELNLKL
jgi:hypothetical protein